MDDDSLGCRLVESGRSRGCCRPVEEEFDVAAETSDFDFSPEGAVIAVDALKGCRLDPAVIVVALPFVASFVGELARNSCTASVFLCLQELYASSD